MVSPKIQIMETSDSKEVIVSVLSESTADEQALQIVLPSLVKLPVRFLKTQFRARGWPSVAQVVPALAHHLHFRTEAHALVVVVDADDSVVHTEDHEREGYFHPKCRLCHLRSVFRRTVKNFPSANGKERTLRCIGVAVPAVEAWYLCGRDSTVSEVAWTEGQARGRLPYTRRELKERLYGTDRPSLALELERCLPEMARHARDPRRLENDFLGFALMAKDLRVVATVLTSPAS